MRHVFHFCWHKAREYLGHLFFIGLFIVLLSRSPEQWVDDQLKWLGGLVTAPDAFAGLKPLWPPWLDVQMVLVGLGIAVSAGSVGWRQIVRRRKQREALRAQPVVLPYETKLCWGVELQHLAGQVQTAADQHSGAPITWQGTQGIHHVRTRPCDAA
jgi:hypothetical protein